MQNVRETSLPQGNMLNTHVPAPGTSDTPHTAVPNPLTVLNMTDAGQRMTNLGSADASQQLGQFHNVMVKPIVPKQHLQATTSILTGGGVSGFRPHPHQNTLNFSQATPHMTPPISSPILPPPSLSSSTFPLAQPILPPTQPSVPLMSSHNTLLSPLPSSAYHSLKTHKSAQSALSANKPRKPCNCKNSQCLKLYCDCFANGEFCRDGCNCQNCKNSRQYEEDRTKAVKACLERNPNAFKPKVGHGQVGDSRRHIKGCNCKKSGCLKNYCECYEAKIPCSYLCRCVSCQNLSDRPEGKGLMELANAADLRTQQQRAASSHFMEQMEPPTYNQLPLDGQKLPYSFVNKEITKATALCLLEEASHAASSGQNLVEVERAVLIEFGRCLEQIINSSESANQNIRESVTGIV